MPNPNFLPVIGRDFSDVAGQQYQWAGFNRGVEEGNMQRAAAAQQAHNDWLLQLRKMQDEEGRTQEAGDMAARRWWFDRSDAARQEAESARRFDVGTDLTKQQQEIEKSRWSFDHGERDKKENQALDATSNYASSKFNTVNAAGQKHDAALAALNDAQQTIDTKRAQLQQSLPPAVQYDPKLKEFKSLNTQDANLTKLAADANLQIAQAKADFDRAQNTFQIHAAELASLHKEANQFGLSIDKQGDRYVLQSFHPKLNHTWGAPKDASQDESIPKFSGPPFSSPPFSAIRTPEPAPATWPGFTAGTGTNSPAAALPPAPVSAQPVPNTNGATVMDFSNRPPATVTDTSGMPVVNSQEDFDRLPPNTNYINGRTKKRGYKP